MTAAPIGGPRPLEYAPGHGNLEALREERLADGWEIVQEGHVDRPPEQGLSFSDRVSDCRVSEIRSGDSLLDDDSRWVHMRRRR